MKALQSLRSGKKQAKPGLSLDRFKGDLTYISTMGLMGKSKQQELEEEARLDDELNKQFKQFDQDNNGVMDVAETIMALQMYGITKTPQEVEDMIAKHGANEEEGVKLEEFKALVKEMKRDLEWRYSLEQAFKILDKDKSGSLEAAEIREALTTMGDKFTEEEIKAFLDQADVDGDGDIDLREFLLLLLPNESDKSKSDKKKTKA